jgi:hypothetical protein
MSCLPAAVRYASYHCTPVLSHCGFCQSDSYDKCYYEHVRCCGVDLAVLISVHSSTILVLRSAITVRYTHNYCMHCNKLWQFEATATAIAASALQHRTFCCCCYCYWYRYCCCHRICHCTVQCVSSALLTSTHCQCKVRKGTNASKLMSVMLC